MKKKKQPTHEVVDQAVKDFLKKGGKIKKLKQDNSGGDYTQKLEQAERQTPTTLRIDPVPFENKFGWGSH